jgi:quercetin dioxygenase-like cupin family protein
MIGAMDTKQTDMASQVVGKTPHLHAMEIDAGVAGVELFLHDVSRISPAAPMKSSRFTMATGCKTPDDKHEDHEIWFIAAGQLSVFYDGEWYDAAAGDALYFHPLKVHRATNNGSHEAVVVSVWWQ